MLPILSGSNWRCFMMRKYERTPLLSKADTAEEMNECGRESSSVSQTKHRVFHLPQVADILGKQCSDVLTTER